MQSLKITNITSEDLEEMLTVATPDEVYSFVAYNLKDTPAKPLKLKWVAHKTHALLSH